MFCFLLFTLFFIHSFAVSTYTLIGTDCTPDTRTGTGPYYGYEFNVYIIQNNFTFDSYDCFTYENPLLLFNKTITVTITASDLVSNRISGVIFEENSKVTFGGSGVLNFDIGNLGYYEFKKNSIINYGSDISVKSDIEISNSSTLNVNGYLEVTETYSLALSSFSTLNVNENVVIRGDMEIFYSIITLTNRLDVFSSCKIINSSLDVDGYILVDGSNSFISISDSNVNVNGPIWNKNKINIENGILNVYQFRSYETYCSYVNSNTLMGITTFQTSTLYINNAEINIYGSNYTDSNHFLNSSTFGFWSQDASTVTISGNSKIVLIPSENAGYLFGVTNNDSIYNSQSFTMNNNSSISTPHFYQHYGNLKINEESTIYIQGGKCSLDNLFISTTKTIENSPMFQSDNNLFTYSLCTLSPLSSSLIFDIFSSFEINTDNYDGLINKCNGRLKRHSGGISTPSVFCEFYGNRWTNEFTVDSNLFNYYHCMNSCGNDYCYIKALTTETIIIENESINVTFIDNNVTLYFNNTLTNYIRINSIPIESSTSTKSLINSNSVPKSLKQLSSINISTSYLIPSTFDSTLIVNNTECGCLLLCLIYKKKLIAIVGYISDNKFVCLITYGCSYGYYMNNYQCNECSTNCRTCNSTDNCYLCEYGYILENGNCIEDFNCIRADRSYCNICNDGLLLNGNNCSISCEEDCISCNTEMCYYCDETFNINGKCQNITNVEIVSNNSFIQCSNSYYNNVGKSCELCNLIYSNCNICDNEKCMECSNGYYLKNNVCESMNCLNSETINGYCNNCDTSNGFIMDENGKCVTEINNCLTHINGYCIDCNDGYILQSQNNCIANEYPDNCITLSYYGTCLRCSDGYYLNKNLCYECSNECTTCYNLTYCFECNDGYMLNDNNECVDMSESNANCKTAIPGSSGKCAICNDGYYRDQTTCYSCISNCTKCNNGESCLTCESNYFLLNDASECISYDDLTNCETKTQSGCTKCVNTYYLNNQYCISCSNTTENCNTCNNNGECLTCQNDYVLINYECIDYQLIDSCKESKDSKCTSCSFWHTLNSDQTGCDTHAEWWLIVLIGIVILIIFIGICVLIWYVIKLLSDWRKQQKQRKEVTIFLMKTSNVKFIPTNNKDVVINKNEILFNDENEEIGVNEETRDLICVGNTSNHTIKVQFSVKDGCDKYEIRTNPQMITIQKGKAIEFEIFIKPLCTCNINDQIMLISVDLLEGKTITTPITINTITIMTTRLDYNELTEDIKLGEGSFGIVYKGTFRGTQVAIKKMKQLNNKQQMEEFNKEVQMLDKFRNDYIVHFYGAVFIPNKICMVTELAQYGSLHDLIYKQKQIPPRYLMKMKILLNCSKGITYLHSNGILHRDIKPDNILILSLQNDVQVNAKLTDFGSSRNINMLMTNMTFTKGIGTPKYMAPEILNRYKYKKAADIYSFAITMYETIIWDDPYPKIKFQHPWSIPDFISSGNRLPKLETMNNEIYSLIDSCWKQNPKDRYSIEVIIKKLEEMI